jgi:restriction system protein
LWAEHHRRAIQSTGNQTELSRIGLLAEQQPLSALAQGMFRYLWKFKLLTAGLIAAFAAGFYLSPIYAWLALGILGFLRVTKLHSYLVMLDLTDRAATKHLRVLATKRIHLLSPDEYGNISDEGWERHLNQFIKRTLLPELQRRKVDHLLVADTKRQLKRLRRRINRIIDRYQPISPPKAEERDLLTGREYEVYCKELLEDADWSVVLTPGSGDQGADIIAEKNGIRVVVQCKFYSSPVGNKAVQEAYAAAGFQDAHYAAVTTNSIFTKSARQLAHKNNVLVLHHEDLAGLEDALRELEPDIR